MVGPRITSRANPRYVEGLADALYLRPKDMKQMLHSVDVEFAKAERKLFSSQGTSGGDAWPKLSPKYAKQKKRTHPGRKIMQRTQRLKKGLTSRGHVDHVARYSLSGNSAKLKVGVKNIVAAYHGAGGGRLRSRRLPVRDVMQLTVTQKSKYRSLVRAEMKAKLDRVRRALAAGAAAMQGLRGAR